MAASQTMRQLPKLSAIPRPTRATHKPRRSSKKKTAEPKENWSGYNVLPAIGELKVRDNSMKIKDSYNKGSFQFDDISDSEFLFDEMTTALEDMFEREAKVKNIRQKAYLQFLELKSDHIDWVMTMARNNVWVPVTNSRTGLPGKLNSDQNSENDDVVTAASDLRPKVNSPTDKNHEVLPPRGPSLINNETTTEGNEGLLVPKPPSYPKGQSQPNTIRRIVQSRPLSQAKCSTFTTAGSSEVPVLRSFSFDDDRSSTSSSLGMFMPRPPDFPINNPPDSDNYDMPFPRPPCDGKALSPTRTNDLIFVPKPPAYPKNHFPITHRPDMFVISPPSTLHEWRSVSRIVRRPKAVPELIIPSPILSPVQELSSSRIE